MDSDVRSGVVTERMVQQTGLMLAGAVLTYFVSQSGYMLRSYPSQLIDCLIWLYPMCLWKICSKDFEPEYPPNNQTRFFSHLLPNVVPRLTLRGGGERILFTKTTVAHCTDAIFREGKKFVLRLISLSFHLFPVGCVMLVDLLQMYHTLTSTQKMRLICCVHDWKLPGRSLNAMGLLTQWKVC